MLLFKQCAPTARVAFGVINSAFVEARSLSWGTTAPSPATLASDASRSRKFISLTQSMSLELRR